MRILIPTIFLSIVTACDTRVYHDQTNTTGNELKGNLPLAAEYDSIAENILQPMCVSCHNSNSAAKGIDLTSYARIVGSTNYPPLIFPNNPDQSNLYISMITGSMPRNAPKLTDAELRAVYDWIKAGALP